MALDFDGIAAAIAARFASGVVTPPAGYSNIRNSTAIPPTDITTTPTVIVTLNEGEFETGNGDRQGMVQWWARFYLDQTSDSERPEVALRKWLSVLVYQLRASTQLGGTFPEIIRVTIDSWKIGVMTYGGLEYYGIELRISTQIAEGWAAAA